MGETLLWRVTGGTAHVTADGSDWPGCPRAMSVDYAIFDGWNWIDLGCVTELLESNRILMGYIFSWKMGF